MTDMAAGTEDLEIRQDVVRPVVIDVMDEQPLVGSTLGAARLIRHKHLPVAAYTAAPAAVLVPVQAATKNASTVHLAQPSSVAGARTADATTVLYAGGRQRERRAADHACQIHLVPLYQGWGSHGSP